MPGVQTDMMMVAASREERGLLAVHHGDLKAKELVIKCESALQIGHLEVDVPDAYLCGNCILTHQLITVIR
jgi:hypothetical protein